MRKILFATFLTLLGLTLVLFPASNLMAQRLTGSATIQILDPSGASVPGARVTLTSKEKGSSIEFQSSAEGVVVVPDLAPGDYSVSVQHEGFKTTSTVASIRVGVASSLVVRMELGAITTEVMVQAEAVTVATKFNVTTSPTCSAFVAARLLSRL